MALQIDVNYVGGAANNDALAGFYTAVNDAVSYLDNEFTNRSLSTSMWITAAF